MSITTKNRLLIITIAALLLINVGLLIYFLGYNSHAKYRGDHKQEGFMLELLKTDVGFNDSQIEEYKKLKKDKEQLIRQHFTDVKDAKDRFFKLIADSTLTDSSINTAAQLIGQRQQELDLEAFYHFKKVRALCTSSAQALQFDSAITKLWNKSKKFDKKKEGKNN